MNTSAPGIQHPYRRQVKDIGGGENTPHPFRWIVPSYNYILSEINPSLKGDEQHKLCLVENTGFLYRLVQAFPPQWDFVFKLDVNTVPSLVKALDDIQALYETKTNQSEFNLMVNAIHQINATLATCITNDRIVNHLGANEPGLVLSAAQGRILKGMIDDINVILGVEGSSIVSLHEIVQYIELNRELLETLSVDSITGLNDALNARVRHTDLAPIHQSISQLADELLPKEHVIDSLEIRNPSFALSAKQGAEIADRLRALETMLDSDDTSLDTLQELVEYIKLNRATLDALNIDSILGLRDEIVKISQNATNLELHDTRLNFLESTIDVLSSAIDTLRSDKIEQGLEIASLEEDILELGALVDTKVSGLTNNVNNLTNLANTTASDFATLAESVTLLETSISDTTLGLSESISLLSSTTNTALSNIGTQLTTQGQSIDAVVSKQENHSTRLDGVDLSLSTLGLSVSGLQNNLTVLEESMDLSNSNLSDRINTTNENVLLNATKLGTLTGTLEQYVLENDSALQSVSNRVVSLESNAQSLATALNTTNSNVTLIADQLSTSGITLNEHQTHLYTLDQKNIEQDSVISQQQQQITQISQLTDSNINTINSLSSDVTVFSQDYNTWKSATDQRLNDIDTTLLSMGSSVSTLTDNLNDIYIELDDRIDIAFSDIENLNGAFGKDLRDTIYTTGTPADLYGTGYVIGFTDGSKLSPPIGQAYNYGTLEVKVTYNDSSGMLAYSRLFTTRDRMFIQRALGPDAWGPWCELISTDHILNTTGQSTEYPMSQKAVTDAVNLALTNLENTLTLNINTLSESTDTRFLSIDQTINDLQQIDTTTSDIIDNIVNRLDLFETSVPSVLEPNVIMDITPIGEKAGITGTVGANDQWFIGGGSTSQDEGYMEIATGDNGTEPIYVRQYINGAPSGINRVDYNAPLGDIKRTLTLLDEDGNTEVPGVLTSNGMMQKVTSSNGTIDLRLGNSFRLTGLPMGTSHPINVIKPDLTNKVMSVTIMIDNQLDLEWPSDITWVETPILGPNYTMVVLAVYEDRTIGQVIVTA